MDAVEIKRTGFVPVSFSSWGFFRFWIRKYYQDILKGDLSFKLNFGAPILGQAPKFQNIQ